MFSRIRLRPEDMAMTLPFILVDWTGWIQHYLYDDSYTPYVAICHTWKAAEHAGAKLEEAGKAIKRSVYVDDYLNSTKPPRKEYDEPR